MFKFMKNLFKINPVQKAIIELNELEEPNNLFLFEPFYFKFDEYGKCCKVELIESGYVAKIYGREYKYNHEEYFYLNGSWDDEFVRTVNILIKQQNQRKEREEFQKKTKDEQSVIYFNNKFKKDPWQTNQLGLSLTLKP